MFCAMECIILLSQNASKCVWRPDSGGRGRERKRGSGKGRRRGGKDRGGNWNPQSEILCKFINDLPTVVKTRLLNWSQRHDAVVRIKTILAKCERSTTRRNRCCDRCCDDLCRRKLQQIEQVAAIGCSDDCTVNSPCNKTHIVRPFCRYMFYILIIL